MVHKQLLRDTNVAPLRRDDRRQLDAVVYGVTRSGLPLCCDATVVTPLTRDGLPRGHRGRAATQDGWALREAEGRKRRRYRELVGNPRGKLVVLGAEVGGRWSSAAIRLVQLCARLRPREAPQLLRASAQAAWTARWWGLLSVAVQDALAASLARDGHLALGGFREDGDLPLADLLSHASPLAEPSRLPARG